MVDLTSEEMRLFGHVEYPHTAGTLYDCEACESECHCAWLDNTCVHCIVMAENFPES